MTATFFSSLRVPRVPHIAFFDFELPKSLFVSLGVNFDIYRHLRHPRVKAPEIASVGVSP